MLWLTGAAESRIALLQPSARASAGNFSNAIRLRGHVNTISRMWRLTSPEKIVVITGLSGSGKSTLAFDILFAEGQRRFLDSMSAYARQFVEQLEKPDVDSIEGLPPSVAIEQRITRGGGKSTVATVTEVYHFLRLLFAKLGTQHCPDCGVASRKADAFCHHRSRSATRQPRRCPSLCPADQSTQRLPYKSCRMGRATVSIFFGTARSRPSPAFRDSSGLRNTSIDALIGEVLPRRDAREPRPPSA